MPQGYRNDGSKLGFPKGIIPWNKGSKGVMKAWNKGKFEICPHGTLGKTRCITCKKQRDIKSKINFARKLGVNYSKYQKIAAQKTQQKYKELIFNKYSNGTNECECCKEKTKAFLSIDHIKGGGNKHLKSLNLKGNKFYIWLKKNNFPEGYRILCMNCNFALGHHSKCPHKNKQSSILKIKNIQHHLIRQQLKQKVLNYYSNGPAICACCGEKHLEFLSIHHINGGGNKERAPLPKGTGFYEWLIKNNYPKGLMVLCINCNFAIGNKKICPHKLNRKMIT